MTAVSLIALLVLLLAHLFAGRLHVLGGIPRSRWLSAAGGVSVSYVFLHLLPELAAGQQAIEQAGLAGFVERHTYLVALSGLMAFYGLERAATTSRARPDRADDERTSAGVFWLHMASFALYNLLIGYLLVRGRSARAGTADLALFTAAMALHFVVTDAGLHDHHRDRYRRIGRWMLATAIAVGWAVGRAVEVPEPLLADLVAFIAGGVVLNVLKEELPEERKSHFGAFLLGAALYAALLLTL